MLANKVHEAVARLRLAGTDLAAVEVKRASGGPPHGLAETVSAFANGVGGLILLGLDESAGFLPCDVDVRKLADALASACADSVEPPVRADIDIVEVEGSPIVAAFIPEVAAERKPCFVRSQGIERGSYLRTHDGDRHLTTYEVHALLSGRGQPRDDVTAVPGARLDHLDPERVDALVARLRRTRGAVFATASTQDVLRMTGALMRDDDGKERVTVAG